MKDYIQKIIHVFTASEHSKELTEEVHQWLVDGDHADEKDAALNALWKETEGRAEANTWVSLRKVYKKIEDARHEERQYRLFTGWRSVAAAVAVLIVSVSATFFLTKHAFKEEPVAMVEQYIPDGSMEEIILPDGSRVHVNSGTLLLYPDAFKGDTRTVYLIGEADFKVQKNPEKPFIVRSADMSVTALGTEFNVTAYPDDTEIVATLLEGKVKVDCNDRQDSYVIHPGQQVLYNRKTSESRVVAANLEDVTAWQRGQFVFRGCTMEEILQTLGRRFDVAFQYNMNLFTGDKYNFSFKKDADVTEIMEVIKVIVGKFDYKIDGNVCYITKDMK